MIETLNKLAQFDSPTISNVIELFQVVPQTEGYPQILHVGQTIRVAGLNVSQGDLLHGDGNGVTRIPVAIAADVADEFVAAEKIILDYAKGPDKKTPDGLAAARREFADVVAKLIQRISG